MSDEEIDEIPRERFMERESILRAKLKDALLERDEARKELVRMDEVYAHEARKERDAMWGELSVLKADLKEAKDRCLQLKLALDEARGELEFRYTLNQHADKSSVDDSTYVLTQPPCQRISWVGTGTDWHAEGYRDGKAVALLPGGTRGAKWHADQKQLQGDAAYEYIDGFNNALDEHEQEEAK